VIAGTTILDGSGDAPFSGDVLVEGPRIVAVQTGLPRSSGASW
jgi:N-acyl-D-aspartate/D-glutamate deacylase